MPSLPNEALARRLRLWPAPSGRASFREANSAAGASAALGTDFDQVMATRRAEADEFYAADPGRRQADEAMVLRQACAGLLWRKQLYYYAVSRWLDGDPAQPEPPPQRKDRRNDSSSVKGGFAVVALDNAQGQGSITVTAGQVTALKHTITVSNEGGSRTAGRNDSDKR